MASHNRRSSANLLSTLSAVYSGDPTGVGVPRTVIPLGCHITSPSSSTLSGTVPEAFHTLVFPSWSRMPATWNSDSANKSNNTRTRYHPGMRRSVHPVAWRRPLLPTHPGFQLRRATALTGRLARHPLPGSPHASVLHRQTTNNSMVWRKTSGRKEAKIALWAS